MELKPFAAAIEHGHLPAIMTAHIAVPALDRGTDGKPPPATLSAPIMNEMLRGEMRFGGLVVCPGVWEGRREVVHVEGAVVMAAWHWGQW